MSYVNIKICRKGDPPAFPELGAGIDAPCLGFAILEKGTASGHTSCAVLTKGADDVPVVVQFTGDMFIAMAAALTGARERFGG